MPGIPFGGCCCGGGGGTLALFALAVGYVICILANKEKGKIRKTGYVIGTIIIVISSIIILVKALWIAERQLNSCPRKGPVMMPMQPGPMPPRK